MENSFTIPFYAKVALVFISLFFFVFTLFIGQQIILPIVYATILGILLNPLVNFLTKRRINRIIAISITVALAIVLFVGILYVISTQVSMFTETYPQLKAKFTTANNDIVHWVSQKFRISQHTINAWIQDTETSMINNLAIGENINAAGRIIVTATLLPVYLFMILFYKPLLLEFIRKLFRKEHQVVVADVLSSTKKIIQSYLVGLFFEMIIIAVLNSAGLLLIGIDYAIILGITGAILNIIPYIGGIIAIALPMIIAFVTKDSFTYPLLVLVVYLIIQFVDNHFIIPKIVASRVQINALLSIIVVLIGGALWGIPGMFLSIPLTAILKVIFDHIDSLKPWGFLLGNIVPTGTTFYYIKQKLKKTKSPNTL
jgi:predicted PurR-regulated permease PerM